MTADFAVVTRKRFHGCASPKSNKQNHRYRESFCDTIRKNHEDKARRDRHLSALALFYGDRTQRPVWPRNRIHAASAVVVKQHFKISIVLQLSSITVFIPMLGRVQEPSD